MTNVLGNNLSRVSQLGVEEKLPELLSSVRYLKNTFADDFDPLFNDLFDLANDIEALSKKLSYRYYEVNDSVRFTNEHGYTFEGKIERLWKWHNTINNVPNSPIYFATVLVWDERFAPYNEDIVDVPVEDLIRIE